MNRKKGGKKADVGFEFDHYDLYISHYQGNLAAYALGRLLRRLQFHHEQAVVLAAESCWERHIPQPEWRGEVTADDPSVEVGDPSVEVYDPRKETNDRIEDKELWKEDERLLKNLLAQIQREANREWNQSELVADQIRGIIARLTTEKQLDSALKGIAQLRKVLAQYQGSEDFMDDAKETSKLIRAFESEPNFEERRIDYLEEFVRVHSEVHFTRFRKLLKPLSDVRYRCALVTWRRQIRAHA